MQKIERYGVIALVFLLVTILAVSLWGESKDGGFLFWKKDAAKDDVAAASERPRPRANGLNGAARNPLAGAARNGAAQRPVGAGLELSAPTEGVTAPQPPRAGFVSTNTVVPPSEFPEPDAAVAPLSQPLFNGALAHPTNDVAVPVGAGTLVRGLPQEQPLTTPGAAPVRNTARTYVVKSGDTLGGIASRELGSTARWTEIQALNGGLDPKRMREGLTLRLPSGPALAGAPTKPLVGGATAPTVASRGKSASGAYTIRSGDTLSAIASRELGEADRWREIAALNPSVDPTRLSVGTVIALPSGRATSASVANAPRLDDRQVVAFGPAPKGKSGVQ